MGHVQEHGTIQLVMGVPALMGIVQEHGSIHPPHVGSFVTTELGSWENLMNDGHRWKWLQKIG